MITDKLRFPLPMRFLKLFSCFIYMHVLILSPIPEIRSALLCPVYYWSLCLLSVCVCVCTGTMRMSEDDFHVSVLLLSLCGSLVLNLGLEFRLSHSFGFAAVNLRLCPSKLFRSCLAHLLRWMCSPGILPTPSSHSVLGALVSPGPNYAPFRLFYHMWVPLPTHLHLDLCSRSNDVTAVPVLTCWRPCRCHLCPQWDPGRAAKGIAWGRGWESSA